MKKLSITKSITPHDSRSLKLYMADIARYPLLTPEEEVTLAQRIHQGDMVAREKMINCNLRFVITVAKQYQSADIDLCDLISQGNMGLIRAVERFDETRGFKFSSYAVWYINQAVMEYIGSQVRMIRLPANKVGLLSQLRKLSSQLEQKLHRRPTIHELAVELDVDESKVAALMSCSIDVSSLNTPSNDDGDGEVLDTISDNNTPRPDSKLMQESLTTAVNDTLKMFSETDRKIITQSFGIGHDHASSLAEIALGMGLTTECVRQRLNKCLKRIRTSRHSTLLASFL